MNPEAVPKTMRTWTWTRPGEPSKVLKLQLDYPVTTQLKPDEVLIKVSHVGMNSGSLIVIKLFPHFSSTPWIPEIEFSGTVIAIGSTNQVDGLNVGDTVFGSRGSRTPQGTLAEYLVSPANTITRMSPKMPFTEAAGLTCVGCTALQAIEVANITRGSKVFVNGGSGGLGSMTVQMCKAVVGETGVVIATCSGPNVEMVKSLGADEVIDYTIHKPLVGFLSQHHMEQPFDAILDTVGSDNTLFTKSPNYLKTNGSFIILGGMGIGHQPSWPRFFLWILQILLNKFLPVMLGGIPRRYSLYRASLNKETLEKIKAHYEDGSLKPITDSIWEMKDVLKAYERQDSQRSRGKIIIDVQN